jgi:AICAR transformylase/IMP cyclohydrolase PurH
MLLLTKIDPEYTPQGVETRQVYGVHLQQKRNDARIDAKLFENIVSKNKEASLRDCLIRWSSTVALFSSQHPPLPT